MIDLTTLTARKIAEAVRRRELTAVAVTQAALERIEQLNGSLRAFITVTRDEALAAAEQVDRKVAAGRGKRLAAGGRAAGDQGQLLDQGGPDDGRHEGASPTSCRPRTPRRWPGSRRPAACWSASR